MYEDNNPYGREPPYEEQPYSYEPQWEQTSVDPYEEEAVYRSPEYAPNPPDPGPEVISTSQAINLTCTLASLSALFALFLCFADQRSRAVRRFAVQSVGLGVIHLAAGMLCWILSALLGWIPFVGQLFVILFIILFVAASCFVLVLRVRMMYRAYRGIAYALPVIGEKLRRYE